MPSLATNSDNLLPLRVYDRDTGDLVDVTDLTLRWKLGTQGDWTEVALSSITHAGTGIYTYSVNPEDTGSFNGRSVLLRYEWDIETSTFTYVERGKVALSSSEFCQ